MALLIAGSSGFALTAIVAARGGTDERERVAFRAANGVTLDYRAVWVPMQYGTFATVPALAGLAFARRRPRLGAGLLLAGTSAYVLAKVAKRSVGRGRPATELDDVVIRGKEEGDLGFPSGHAAVSAALSTAAAPFLPPVVRMVAVGLTTFVSFARVHVGAHLPLDVAGGVCLGVALGSGVNLMLGMNGDRPSA